MSNRTDYGALVEELRCSMESQPATMESLRGLLKRVETELHNAHVAGSEGSACECTSCLRIAKGLEVTTVEIEADDDAMRRAADRLLKNGDCSRNVLLPDGSIAKLTIHVKNK